VGDGGMGKHMITKAFWLGQQVGSDCIHGKVNVYEEEQLDVRL
jgi:hypothetical protein